MATIDGNFDDMETLIDCISSTYSSAPVSVSAANFAVLIGLANKFQIDSILKQCKSFVLSSHFDFTHIDEAVLLQMLKAVALVGTGTKDMLAKLISRAAVFDLKTLKEHSMNELPGPIAACLFYANASRSTTEMYSHQMDILNSSVPCRIPTVEIEPDFLDSFI